MGLYIGLAIAALVATFIFHIVIWKFFFKPRLQKHAELLAQSQSSKANSQQEVQKE